MQRKPSLPNVPNFIALFSLLALLMPPAAAGQERAATISMTYSDAVLERSEETPVREVLQKGLIIEASGFDGPQEFQLVGILTRDGELVHAAVGDPLRLETGTTMARPGEGLGTFDEILGEVLGEFEITAEPQPANRYRTFERPLSVEQILPNTKDEGPLSVEQILPNTKDVGPLMQRCCTGEHVPSGELLVLFLTPVDRELKEGIQTRPVMIGGGGGAGKVN